MAGEPTSLSGVRIALTSSGLSHVLRGVETWTQEAFEGLRQAGVAVTLFKGSGENGLPDMRVVPCVMRGSGLSHAMAKMLRRGGWRIGLGAPYQTEQTTFALSLLASGIGRFDLIHTKDPQVAAILQWAHRIGLSQARVILSHGTEEPPEFLGRFDYLQHLAPSHRLEMVQQGVEARRHFVVPNFVDTERFRPNQGGTMRRELGISPEAFVVLSVAAIKRHHKRIDWLIEETARLTVPGRPVYLVIAGASTEDTASLMRLGLERLGSRVRFLVDRPRGLMPSLYGVADVFVLCSLKEMLSNAVLEALASGVPCLVSSHPVNRWAIGKGGESVDMGRPGALAEAIARYAGADVRQAASLKARQRVVSVFAKDVVLAQQLEMYREVLEDRRT